MNTETLKNAVKPIESTDLLAVARWLTGNHTGASSKYMLAVAICGEAIPQRFGDSTPRDEPDLQRCLALIELAPSVRNCFPVLRTASPVWAAFVDHWDALAVISEENDYAATTGRMNALRSSANVQGHAPGAKGTANE